MKHKFQYSKLWLHIFDDEIICNQLPGILLQFNHFSNNFLLSSWLFASTTAVAFCGLYLVCLCLVLFVVSEDLYLILLSGVQSKNAVHSFGCVCSSSRLTLYLRSTHFLFAHWICWLIGRYRVISPSRSNSFWSGLMFYPRCFFYSSVISLRCIYWLAQNFAWWSYLGRIL